MEEIKNVTILPEYYEEQLQHIIDAGFKPIGVSQMAGEDTFIFRHKDEAHKAYEEMEQKYMFKPWSPDNDSDGCVQGWWYGFGDFIKAAEEYEDEFVNGVAREIVVYWFNETFIRNGYKT